MVLSRTYSWEMMEKKMQSVVLPFAVLCYSLCFSSSLLSTPTKAERRNTFINNLDLVLILQWRFWGSTG